MHLAQLPVGCCSPEPSGRQVGVANMCRRVWEDVSYLGEGLSSTVPPMRSSLSESLPICNDLFHGCQLTFLNTLVLQNCSTAVLGRARGDLSYHYFCNYLVKVKLRRVPYCSCLPYLGYSWLYLHFWVLDIIFLGYLIQLIILKPPSYILDSSWTHVPTEGQDFSF